MDKVRQLQRRLWAAAKRPPERRFHALYDRIPRSDVLAEAWKRVRRNKGAAGVDAQTIAAIEEYGVERFLEELASELRAGEYRPSSGAAPVHSEGRWEEATAGHSDGPGPSGADGGEARAGADLRGGLSAVLVRLPAEAERDGCAGDAAEARRKGCNHVLDADIRDYFGSIDHEKLMKLVSRARLGSAGAEAAAAVARGGSDGRRAW